MNNQESMEERFKNKFPGAEAYMVPDSEEIIDFIRSEKSLSAREAEERIIKRIQRMVNGDGCSCHINAPCDYCTDEKNSLIQEIIEDITSNQEKV